MSYIFKVSINVDDYDQVNHFLQNMDDYICLSNLFIHAELGLCLGVVKFTLENGEEVRLALYMVNEDLKYDWIRLGGIEIDIDMNDFRSQLYNTALDLVKMVS